MIIPPKDIETRIFEIKNVEDFIACAMDIFHFQEANNMVYREYVKLLKAKPRSVEEIPFLPIEFFKTHEITTGNHPTEIIFESSGTTGSVPSKHFVPKTQLYEKSFSKCFQLFYGLPQNYCMLALLPSYLERQNSSLVYMVNDLIQKSGNPDSGFYLHNTDDLTFKLKYLAASKTKTLLIGVSYALLDLAERIQLPLSNTIIMETGGMKGKRQEMVRNELHDILCKSFGVEKIHSEYGMTELFSQAYSFGNGIFHSPPWMKVLVRNINDPMSRLKNDLTGGINIIDLANIYSCSFIATQDLGKVHEDQTFEVLGRFDNTDLRGCNLMVS